MSTAQPAADGRPRCARGARTLADDCPRDPSKLADAFGVRDIKTLAGNKFIDGRKGKRGR